MSAAAGGTDPKRRRPAGTTGRSRRERLEASARREQILRCAKKLFTERQYAAVSMEEISQAAGIRRGLVNHYFGSKRALFIEVVRDILSAFGEAFPAAGDDRPRGTVDQVVTDHVDRWMTVVENDADAWFALVAAEGFGRDHDVEHLVERARDAMVEAIVAILGRSDDLPPDAVVDPSGAGENLRVVLRAYSGFAEVVTHEWLQRESIDRAQAQVLLTTALLSLTRDAVPALQEAVRDD